FVIPVVALEILARGVRVAAATLGSVAGAVLGGAAPFALLGIGWGYSVSPRALPRLVMPVDLLLPFACGVFKILDPEAPSDALEMLSLVAATPDDPLPILCQEQSTARYEALQATQAGGIEYDKRM
ncbi:DUF3516 domain-containing protein, partial [Clavibacter michiganensis]|uniref:DUF3516 domain-containing protein n=1 Tax=Clavibacter michiganensis TaxID=28447 RepID=UPI00292DF2AB